MTKGITVMHMLQGVVRKEPIPIPKWIRDAKQRPAFTDAEILEALEDHHGNIVDTAKALSMQTTQVRIVARRNGKLDPSKQRRVGRPKGYAPTEKQKIPVDLEQVIERRNAGEKMDTIARSMGITSNVIYARLKEIRGD